MEKKPIGILPQLLKMAPGEVAEFPIERSSYVRQQCCRLGVEKKMIYRTSTSREDGVIRAVRLEA